MIVHRHSTQLALRAALLLALEPDGRLLPVSKLAASLGVSAPYLVKVLQRLTQVGLLRSVRGPGGGLRLARSSRDIRLWDILSATSPVDEYEQCVLSLEKCSDTTPCPLHELWSPVRQDILHSFHTLSLWELAEPAKRKAVVSETTAAPETLVRAQDPTWKVPG